MAVMIPRHPKEFDPKSREDEVFLALKNLPDEYYVFHSVSLLKVFKDYEYNGDFVREERQTDFVVFHPQKGIICIEAKNWRDFKYCNGSNGDEEGWYLNGQLYLNAKYNGPFEQADSFCRDFRDCLCHNDNSYVRSAIFKSKVLPAVWLLPKHDSEITKMSLPINVNRNSILSFEDLHSQDSLENKLNSIFETRIIHANHEVDHFEQLSPLEATELIAAIAPNITISFEKYVAETNQIVFNQMLRQQYVILDFLQDQKSAVISGAAGTGKTMLAIEKARRHAKNNEEVLYLCFNSELAKQLSRDFSFEHVCFSTLDLFCCNTCGHKFSKGEMDDFYSECLEIVKNIDPDDFKYKHFILDEGQDICINPLIERILDEIKALIELKEGTFYIFYDKMQLMPYTDRDHNGKLPQIITDSDCKLTLYKNCRNTKKIARSASVTITTKPPQMMDSAPDGDSPKICYCSDVTEIRTNVSSVISKLVSKGYRENEIVILSLKGEDRKLDLGKELSKRVLYTTVNRFKGLEAKAVIIVDFDQSTLSDSENCTLYYVAASRAREQLYIFTTMSDSDVERINSKVFKWYINGDNPNQKIAKVKDRRSLETAAGLRRIKTE